MDESMDGYKKKLADEPPTPAMDKCLETLTLETNRVRTKLVVVRLVVRGQWPLSTRLPMYRPYKLLENKQFKYQTL